MCPPAFLGDMKVLPAIALVAALGGTSLLDHTALAGPPSDPTTLVRNTWDDFARNHATKGAVIVIVGPGYLGWYQFGTRDDDGNPMTLKTPINLASNTKPFVATDLSLAEDAGVVDVNTTIGTLMPSLPSDAMPRGAKLRQLAGFSAGFPKDIPKSTSYYDSTSMLTLALTQCDQWTDSCGVPGGHIEYSNLSYAVLGSMLAIARNKAQWSDVVQADILDPLGMVHTCTRGSGCNPTFLSTHAVGHTFDGNPKELPEHTPIKDAFEGLWTTGEDMAIWLEYQVGGIVPSSDPQTTKLNNALRKTRNHLNSAFGWSYQFSTLTFINDMSPTTIREKAGQRDGQTSYMAIADAKHYGIFVYVNQDSLSGDASLGGGLGNELRDHLAFPILKKFNH